MSYLNTWVTEFGKGKMGKRLAGLFPSDLMSGACLAAFDGDADANLQYVNCVAHLRKLLNGSFQIKDDILVFDTTRMPLIKGASFCASNIFYAFKAVALNRYLAGGYLLQTVKSFFVDSMLLQSFASNQYAIPINYHGRVLSYDNKRHSVEGFDNLGAAIVTGDVAGFVIITVRTEGASGVITNITGVINKCFLAKGGLFEFNAYSVLKFNEGNYPIPTTYMNPILTSSPGLDLLSALRKSVLDKLASQVVKSSGLLAKAENLVALNEALKDDKALNELYQDYKKIAVLSPTRGFALMPYQHQESESCFYLPDIERGFLPYIFSPVSLIFNMDRVQIDSIASAPFEMGGNSLKGSISSIFKSGYGEASEYESILNYPQSSENGAKDDLAYTAIDQVRSGKIGTFIDKSKKPDELQFLPLDDWWITSRKTEFVRKEDKGRFCPVYIYQSANRASMGTRLITVHDGNDSPIEYKSYSDRKLGRYSHEFDVQKPKDKDWLISSLADKKGLKSAVLYTQVEKLTEFNECPPRSSLFSSLREEV